jgi:uncharacterized protein (TIGR00290 family)
VDADIVLMGSRKKVTISWSGGKDSAFALFRVLLSGEYEVVHLHTVFNASNHRVGLHGIHETLIERQAESLGLKLHKLFLEESSNHDSYEKLMTVFYLQCAAEKIESVVFGDIFLEDLRIFRETMLTKAKMTGVFPLWKADTKMLLEDFINTGFKTLLCAADKRHFKDSQLGKTLDHNFIDTLRPGIDPCGENGEFHTFVYDGPIFKHPVIFQPGEVISKSYQYKIKTANGEMLDTESMFWFKELLVNY